MRQDLRSPGAGGCPILVVLLLRMRKTSARERAVFAAVMLEPAARAGLAGLPSAGAEEAL